MRKIFRNLIYVSSAVIWLKFIGMFTTFLVAKLLEPADYGLWISLLLVMTYSGIAHLGTVAALLKEGAFFIGKRDRDKVAEIERGVLGSVMLSGGFMLLLGLVLPWFFQSNSTPELPRLIRLVFLAAILGLFSLFHGRRFEMRQDFHSVSLLDFLRATLDFVFYVTLAWLWGLKGIVLGLVICELILCSISSYLSIHNYGFPGISFDMGLIRKLIAIGFPIMIINSLFILITSVDRVMAVALLGTEPTGFYGLGASIVSMVVLIPYAVSHVLYPRINEKLGLTLDERSLTSLIMRPAQTLSLLLPFAIGILILLSPVVYYVLLPKYGPGLLAAQILLAGCFFIALMRNGANFLIATNRQGKLLTYMVISMVVNILGNFILVELGYDINGIAASTAGSQFLLGLLVWRSVLGHLGYSKVEQLKTMVALHLPFVLMAALGVTLRIAFGTFFREAHWLCLLHLGLLLALFSLSLLCIPRYRDWFKEILSLVRVNMVKTT